MPDLLETTGVAELPRNGRGVDELRKCLVAKEETILSLESKLTAGKCLQEFLSGRIHGLGDQLNSSATTEQALRQDLALRQTTEEEIRAQLAALQAQVVAMTSSMSWKLAEMF